MDDKPYLYTDYNHVVESLKTAAEDYADGFTLRVIDSDRAVIVAETADALDDRNLWEVFNNIDDVSCVIEGQRSQLGGIHAELKFHEKVVENPIEIMPAGPDAIDASQATDPRELGPALARALGPIVEAWDVMFTFSEVSAGSVAHGGHYTDFEYEYSIDGIGF